MKKDIKSAFAKDLPISNTDETVWLRGVRNMTFLVGVEEAEQPGKVILSVVQMGIRRREIRIVPADRLMDYYVLPGSMSYSG